MERGTLVARGPGRLETLPVATDAASSHKETTADRIITWQNELILRNEIRPRTQISERVLILTGSPWVFDRVQQSSLKAVDTIVAWLEPNPAAAKTATATPSTGTRDATAKKTDSEDGGYQIRRCLP